MSETHEIEYALSEDQLERAYAAGLVAKKIKPPPSTLRSVLLWAWVGLLVVAIIAHWTFLGFSCLVPVFGGFALVLAGAHLITCWFHRRLRAEFNDEVRRIGSSPIRWTLSNDTITIQSELNAKTYPWSEISRIELVQGFWAISQKSGRTVLLPAHHFSRGALRYVLRQARDAGATICLPTDVQADYDDGMV